MAGNIGFKNLIEDLTDGIVIDGNRMSISGEDDDEIPGEYDEDEEDEEEDEEELNEETKDDELHSETIVDDHLWRWRPSMDTYFDDDSESDDEPEPEEEEEEEEETEEEIEEEEEVEEVPEVDTKTQEEIEWEYNEARTMLINEYIKAKALLKYERKRNAYFQDRIFRTSVRKGILNEAELENETATKAAMNKKRKKKCRPKNAKDSPAPKAEVPGNREDKISAQEKNGSVPDLSNLENSGEADEELKVEEASEGGIEMEAKEQGSEQFGEIEEEENENEVEVDTEDEVHGEFEIEEEETKTRRKRKRRKKDGDSEEEEDEQEEEQAGAKRGFIGEKFSSEAKYQKLLRKILKLQKAKEHYLARHHANLQVHSERRKEWNNLHTNCLYKLLDKIREQSKVAVDSNTGKIIPKYETEDYCGELIRIHRKLCETMLKMYKSRRGLEFTLKRLHDSEVQEGEQIEILEYEQLRDENGTLKDRLGDRVKEVENIKAKIAYAIQIQAHVQAKMSNMADDIADGELRLKDINQEVLQAKVEADITHKAYSQIKKQERSLVVDSGLLDNTNLLRNFHETNSLVSELSQEKKQLERKLIDGNREMNAMQASIMELKGHYPELFENKHLGQSTKKSYKKTVLTKNSKSNV